MTTTAGTYKLRFYEKDPTVKFTVELMLAFPDNMQTMIGRGFNRLAERDFRAKELLSDFKSLGTDKVLSLHKAQMKRRTYDRNRSVHQAMSYLMVLPQESQRGLALKVSELMGFMQDYLKLCKTHAIPPQREILEKIADTYSEQGAAMTEALMGALEVAYVRLQADAKGSRAGEPGSSNTLKDEQAGLRIIPVADEDKV